MIFGLSNGRKKNFFNRQCWDNWIFMEKDVFGILSHTKHLLIQFRQIIKILKSPNYFRKTPEWFSNILDLAVSFKIWTTKAKLDLMKFRHFWVLSASCERKGTPKKAVGKYLQICPIRAWFPECRQSPKRIYKWQIKQ